MASARLEDIASYTEYENPNKERTWTVFLASISVSLATVNFGYALGYTAQAELRDEFTKIFNPQEGKTFSIFASVVALGALVGSLLAGWLIDKIGRKCTLLCTSLFYAPGWLLITYGITGSVSSQFRVRYLPMLYIGRTLTGIGVGMSSLTVPVYIAEVASARTRGGFGNLNQLSINFGFLITYTVGLSPIVYFPPLAPVLIVLLNVSCVVFMPETPRWLLANNQRPKAIKALSWLRGNDYEIEEEIFEIESTLGFQQQEKWTRDDLKEPIFYRPLIIALLLMFFQEFSGINSILFYCTFIFRNAGIGPGDNLKKSAEFTSILVCTTLFVFTLISCLLVDRVGRRKLFLTGSVVMTMTLFVVGCYFQKFPPFKINSLNQAKQQELYASFTLVATLLYIAFFSIGWGPLPWLLMSEFFPLKTRGLATSIVTFANWLFVFTTTVIFDRMVHAIGQDGLFWFFGFLTFFGLLFTLCFVPETKGKPLEDVTDMFLNNQIWRLNRNCRICCGTENI